MKIDPKNLRVMLRVRTEDGSCQADIEYTLEQFAELFEWGHKVYDARSLGGAKPPDQPLAVRSPRQGLGRDDP